MYNIRFLNKMVYAYALFYRILEEYFIKAINRLIREICENLGDSSKTDNYIFSLIFYTF
jgi:hypothetical protein